MSASSWVAVLIAGLGILGTLAATALAQLGEGKRASRARQVEATRRAEDRQDALERERREAIRSDYRGILRFISRTRIFVLEMRARLTKLEDWPAHASSDAREVEDLAYKAWSARGLRTTWSQSFDEIADFGPKIAGGMSVALHFKVDGNRLPHGIADVSRSPSSRPCVDSSSAPSSGPIQRLALGRVGAPYARILF